MIEFPSTTVVNRILPKDKFLEHLDLTPNLKKKLISDIVHIKILNKFSKSVLNFIDFSSQNRHCEPSLDGVAIQNEEMRDKRQEIRELTTASDGNSQNRYCEERSDVAIQNCKVEAIEKPIKEVLLLQIELKKHDFDSKLIETIAKQNSHKLVFLLRFDKYAKLAIYYKQLYIGKWKPFEEVSLTLNGNNMNEVWLSFVEQIALEESRRCSPTNGGGAGEQSETEGVLNKSDLDHKLDLQNKAKALEKEIAKLDTAIRREKQPNRKFELHKKLMELEKSLKALRFRV